MELVFPSAHPQPCRCWYMCKYCWRSYKDMEKLFQHKFDNHRQLFLGTSKYKPKKKRKPYTRRKPPVEDRNLTEGPSHLPSPLEIPSETDSPSLYRADDIPNEILAVIESAPLVAMDIQSADAITMFLFRGEETELPPMSSSPDVNQSSVPIKNPLGNHNQVCGPNEENYSKLCPSSFISQSDFINRQRTKSVLGNSIQHSESSLSTRPHDPLSANPGTAGQSPASGVQGDVPLSPPNFNVVTCSFCKGLLRYAEYGNHRKVCSKRLRNSFTTKRSALFRRIGRSSKGEVWRTDVDILKKLARGNYHFRGITSSF